MVYVKKVQESIDHRLTTIEKSLHDNFLNKQLPPMPPWNPFALIVTPTCTNSQHMKDTFSGLTNHPDNQCPSQKATSVSPSATAEPSPSLSVPSLLSENTVTNSLLKQILIDKEENPLPPIDKASLWNQKQS